MGGEAKSILVKTYFREKEKEKEEKVNKLLLVTVTCGDGVRILTTDCEILTPDSLDFISTKYDAFTVIIYVLWKTKTS